MSDVLRQAERERQTEIEDRPSGDDRHENCQAREKDRLMIPKMGAT